MPFQSESQRRKFYSMKDQGTMSQGTIDEWNKDTPANLPEKVRSKPVPPPPSKKKRPGPPAPPVA